MAMSELNPCPFCGYALTRCEGVCEKEVEGSDEYQVEFTGICCPSCAVFLPKQNENDTAQDGIDFWNARPGTNLNRLKAAINWCIERDDRNGSLPEAYREKLLSVLE